MSFLEDDAKYVWHPFTQIQTEPSPLLISSAKGASLFTADGKEYLDCNSSWWVNVHGHGNEHLANAIQTQFAAIDHVIFAGATHEKAIELSKRIVEKLNCDLQKVFFSDNGSTAVEVAIKMCMQFWHNQGIKKSRVLALEGAYHGDTFGAMSVGERDYFNAPFEPFFFNVDFLEFPTEANEKELLERAKTLFETGEFISLIVEPLIQGSAGMRFYSVSFLEALVNLAKANNVLVIFDEIMTAFGRTGTLFAFEHTNVRPDIICLSKGLTGGVLPLGLTVATNAIFDAFLSDERAKAFLHGHSFTGNPLACAAACASLDLFEQAATWENIKAIETRNLDFLQKLEKYAIIENPRVYGTILAFDLKTDGPAGYFSTIRDTVYTFFLENGLLLRPLGNVLFINPPYCLTEKEQLRIFEVIERFLMLGA
ncbi:MAG: adenosylmethionine--8-amino-7-oxononanoate transaminase [Flavobacteriales bacterium]|nr:adenosylmethionine--8-amino-7-oxononanoate transaminase [Flavobacteriales bacterium]